MEYTHTWWIINVKKRSHRDAENHRFIVWKIAYDSDEGPVTAYVTDPNEVLPDGQVDYTFWSDETEERAADYAARIGGVVEVQGNGTFKVIAPYAGKFL